MGLFWDFFGTFLVLDRHYLILSGTVVIYTKMYQKRPKMDWKLTAKGLKKTKNITIIDQKPTKSRPKMPKIKNWYKRPKNIKAILFS